MRSLQYFFSKENVRVLAQTGREAGRVVEGNPEEMPGSRPEQMVNQHYAGENVCVFIDDEARADRTTGSSASCGQKLSKIQMPTAVIQSQMG